MNAQAAYQALNGVFCVYKPTGCGIRRVIESIKKRLTKELNEMPYRPQRQRIKFVDGINPSNSAAPAVVLEPDLTDHPLVVGHRYAEEDIDLQAVNALPAAGSGVMVMTIGAGRRYVKSLVEAQHMKVYHVTGMFGRSTQDFSVTGRLVEKTTYRHIRRHFIDKVVAAMQAGHHKNMFHAAGVNIQSQEAYEMVASGLLRPQDSRITGPAIFGMKCIEYQPPEFVLEIHAMNEKGVYLMKLVHNIGLTLRSSASCQRLRRIRDGHFTLTHALLSKHWDVQSIIDNITFCQPLLEPETIERTALFQTVENTKLILEPGADAFLEGE